MKGFIRDDRFLSLCGLNCGLCSMQHGVDYCFECEAFPCPAYDGIYALMNVGIMRTYVE